MQVIGTVASRARPATTAGWRENGALRGLRAWYAYQLRRGVDATTPTHLIDRIVYGNFVYLVASGVNALMVVANAALGAWPLLVLNLWYQGAVFWGMALTSRHQYLSARLGFLSAVALGFALETGVQGTAVHGERYFLMLAVIAFSMFHPSERRHGVAFASAATMSYLAFTIHDDPVLAWEWLRVRHGTPDQITNEVGFVIGFLFALVGIVNAYGGATRLVDEQRARAFEDNRLSALGAMACNVAHEINTPLMAMDLHLDELEFSLADDPARTADHELVTKLGQLSRRIATIVRGFKLVSHGGADDPPSPTTLGALVGAAVDLATGRIRPLGIALSVSLPEPDVALRCRIVGVSQIILNLIGNAIDAIAELPPARRWIRIEATADDTSVALAVTDAGQLVDPVVRGRLFEAFYTTKPLGKGTGLGLSLSRQTAKDHGGRLRFDDRAQHTRFVLELPRALTDAKREAG
jgi:signal transduction histidine kinase